MKFLPLLFVLLCTYGSYCLADADNQMYVVAVREIPERFEPRLSLVNTRDYIDYHLYYPLFLYSKSGELFSNVLAMDKTKVTDMSFTSFELCLKKDLKFSDGSTISGDDFYDSLIDAHKAIDDLEHHPQIELKGECLFVKLAKPDFKYFDKLTNIKSTILKIKNKNDRVPVGLGTFVLKEHSPSKIVLERTVNDRQSVKQLEFVKFVDNDQALAAGVSDWNHIYQNTPPEQVLKAYQQVTRPLSKSYIVLTRIKNANLRRRFVQCFPVDEFVPILNIKLQKIPGYLPKGIPGYEVSFRDAMGESKEVCSFTGKNKPKIQLFNYNKDIQANLASFFATNDKRLPISVQVEQKELGDVVKNVFETKGEFLAVMANEGSYNQPFQLFNAFYQAPKLIPYTIPSLENKIDMALNEQGQGGQEKLFRQAHELLMKSGYLIPLGQSVSVQYYPPWISNIEWFDKGQGFPQVNSMQVKR